MTAQRARRVFAASVTAAALAAMGVVAVGATAASAADVIPPNSYFGGTTYLFDANAFTAVAPNATLAWDAPVDLVKDVNDYTAAYPVPAGAQAVYSFISKQGDEADSTKWNAYTGTQVIPGGQTIQPVTPYSITTVGQGTPSGTAAVAATSGPYSIGWAYTDNTLHVIPGGLFFAHITLTGNVNPTLATYTWTPVEVSTPSLPSTTTTITQSPTTLDESTPVHLEATVGTGDSTVATGTVHFYFTVGSHTYDIYTPVNLVNGLAALDWEAADVQTITDGEGPGTFTAVLHADYSGDTTHASSTTTKNISVGALPIGTTVTPGAESADGTANHPVVLSADVTPVGAVGTVAFTGTNPNVAGGAPQPLASNVAVNASGHAQISVTGMSAGTWTINATFTGVAPYVSSSSTTAAHVGLVAGYPSSDPDNQNVTATIPDGTLTITTPYTSDSPLDLKTAVLDDATATWNSDSDATVAGYQPTVFGSATDQSQAIQIMDTRAGAPGFTAYVKSTDFASGLNSFGAQYLSFIDVAAQQVPDNTLKAVDIASNDVDSLSASAQQFAKFTPAVGSSTGTAWISGDVKLTGVPSSVQPGQYTATLTFTAL